MSTSRTSVSQIARFVGLMAVAAGATWLLTRPPALAPPRPQALSITLPAEHAFVDAALSPDGSALVYTAIAGGRAQLFLRRLHSFEVMPLEGTENAAQPFFAPDGTRVGFFAGGWLKWLALDGSAPIEITPVAGTVAGATWGPGDEIVYAPLGRRGLELVALEPEHAALPEALTDVDLDAGEVSHGWPHFLPDGQSLLFTVARQDRDPQVAWLSRDSSDYELLAPVDGAAFYVESGQIVFARRGEIFVTPVDVVERKATGPTLPLGGGVAGSAIGYDRLGRSSLTASRGDRLLYVDLAETSIDNALVWVDQTGTAVDVDGIIAAHQAPRVAPDGSRIAVAVRSDTFRRDLWLLDSETKARRQLTEDAGDNHTPLWSADGRITFASNREGPQRIYRTTTDVRPTIETLVFGDGRTPGSWSPNGRRLFFHESYPDRGRDIWMWRAGPDDGAESSLIVGTAANERAPSLSADGRWLAYVSDAADGDQVYVRAQPGQTSVRVSTTGGAEPVWARDGSSLYFRHGRDLFAVSVDTDTGQVGQPRRLFAGIFVRDPGGNVASYDTALDGKRFLMLRPSTRPAALRVISNFESLPP